MDWLWVAIGLVLLVLGGDALVKGAVNLALRLGIPALVVGLTIVAFGTSAPELLVSLQAAYAHQPGIALGNVIGSNICNVLLVLGVPAIIQTLHTGADDYRRSYLTMMAASLLFIALAFLGPLRWWHGVILLAGLSFMLLDSYKAAMAHRRTQKAEELEGADPKISRRKIAVYLAAGLVGLPVGADLLVYGASSIARDFGVSESVIGLTLVALGTSLPELAASVAAAARKQADVAIGNVIGSNIFNLLAIIGVTSLVYPLKVPPELLRSDVWIMLVSSAFLAPFVLSGRNITGPVGIAFCALYVIYCAALVLG